MRRGYFAGGYGAYHPMGIFWWSWRIFTKQVWNSSISKNKRNSLWSFSATSELKNNFATPCRSSPIVVNSRPTTVAWRSHSASGIVHSTMTTGCDVTRRAVRCCQRRLFIKTASKSAADESVAYIMPKPLHWSLRCSCRSELSQTIKAPFTKRQTLLVIMQHNGNGKWFVDDWTQEALQMQRDRATRQEYEISYSEKIAIKNDLQGHSRSSYS